MERGASDLGVARIAEEGEVIKGDIVLVKDDTAAWENFGGKWEASMRGEFARVVDTEGVLREREIGDWMTG